MSRQENIHIFQATLHTIEAIPRLKTAIAQSTAGTHVYIKGELNYPPTGSPSNIVTISPDTTILAAQKLHQKYKSGIAILNFASATNPGGGVLGGSSAQEESLCRSTTLYPSLKDTKVFESFYQFHRAARNLKYSSRCIVVPNVLIIKDDDGFDLPSCIWVNVDVISCAAPNLRDMPYNNMNPGPINKPLHITDKQLYDIHVARAKCIINAAIHHKDNVLVLGAFGCGAFQNNPHVVAKAYLDVIPQYAGYFEEIRFAIAGNNESYKVFRDILKPILR